MADYYLNEAVFDLPGAFVDRTVNVFDMPLRDGEEAGLIVCRTRFPPGKTLREVVSDHVKHEAKTLGGYAVLESREVERAGVPTIELSSRWRHDEKVIYQTQAHLVVFDTWLIFGMNAPLEDRVACDECMNHVLTTLKLRDHG